MRVKAEVQALGKVSKPYVDREGKDRLSYAANIMQNNGEIIDTIRLNQEQFNTITAGKVYTITADYGTGSNGGYLRIIDIVDASK